MAVPLIVQDRVVGVMDLESERIGFFTEDHVRLLGLLAPQIASSVENARLYEELALREQRMDQDLKAARKLQSVLLPRTAPEIEGLEVAIRLRPAREISGDIYDIFQHGSEYAVFAFGDVSGKGRGRGALRRAGQRIAAHAGIPEARPGGVVEAGERCSAGAQSGCAVRHADGARMGEPKLQTGDGQRGRHSADDLPQRRNHQAQEWRVFPPGCSKTASIRKSRSKPSRVT